MVVSLPPCSESRPGGWHSGLQVWGRSMVSVKRYLWLIHLALIAAGVYIGSDLFWAIVGSRIETW